LISKELSMMDNDRRRTVRRLNDQLRARRASGRVVVTQGVAAKGPEFVAQALQAVAEFDAFDHDNDPHGEHDFGAMIVAGERLFWKIDYYDRSLTSASPDPADSALTVRVLTVMLASEY
jgi:hypothetical protein